MGCHNVKLNGKILQNLKYSSNTPFYLNHRYAMHMDILNLYNIGEVLF